MSIATSPVQIGRRPSPITLTDIATGRSLSSSPTKRPVTRSPYELP